MFLNKKFPCAGIIPCIFIMCFMSIPCFAQIAGLNTTGEALTFTFNYNTGDSYRILNTIDEIIFIDHQYSHSSTIINRIYAEVTDKDEDGLAALKESCMTSEEAVGADNESTFSWGEEYESSYQVDSLGNYTVGADSFIPQVRNVPVFPDYAIKPGDSWQAEGLEAYDLRQNFKISQPYILPFTAYYTYLGTVTDDEGKTLHVFSVKYSNYYKSNLKDKINTGRYAEIPVSTMTFSDEIIYFDREKGQIDHYTENFRILMETSYGTKQEFTGTSHSEMTEIVQASTKENVDLVQQQVEDLGIENITVSQGDKGLTISLEDIKFKPDSAILMESEKEKLKAIAEILLTIPENDILVVGHTALAGTEKVRLTLSEQRARAVAAYLISLGVRDKQHIFTQGVGATQPIASNSTEEGKARNRRVEIIILDK